MSMKSKRIITLVLALVLIGSMLIPVLANML